MTTSIDYIFRWKKAHEEYLMDNKVFLMQGGKSKKVNGLYSKRNLLLFMKWSTKIGHSFSVFPI
ncbi:hypothetical protein MASR2M36_25260 [Providencia sp.]